MNIRKSVDYSALFAALDKLVAAALPQMELYCEIGRLVSSRPEKGATVAAAEYLSATYPYATGFSPRNLRRMREFYRAYESDPEALTQAMTIGWTQNVVILEAERFLHLARNQKKQELSIQTLNLSIDGNIRDADGSSLYPPAISQKIIPVSKFHNICYNNLKRPAIRNCRITTVNTYIFNRDQQGGFECSAQYVLWAAVLERAFYLMRS